MIPALILLAALCALGLVLWLLHRRDVRRGASTELHGPKVVVPPAHASAILSLPESVRK